jgi:hypothetical protein
MTQQNEAGVGPLHAPVGRLVNKGADLWPRPTVEQAFADMLAADELRTKKLRAAREALAAAIEAANDVAQMAADTVRRSIMQRDNAGTALRAVIAAALPIVREYARHNPCWTDGLGATQDPNGAHAWLARHEPPNV